MPSGGGRYDFEVDTTNRNSTYGLIYERVPEGASVLDIGCSSGNLGLALERLRGCRVVGIDVDPDAVQAARTKGLEAHLADVARETWPPVLRDRHFDVIILADVLEHVVNPAGILAPVGNLLNPGGRVLCSFPNISHVDVALMLLQDQWRTQPTGILDETHLRFFTLASFTDLAVRCGYDIAAIERVRLPPLGTEVLDYGKACRFGSAEQLALEIVARQASSNCEVYQYVVELHPAPERTVDGPRALLESSAAAEEAAGEDPGRLDVIVRSVEGRLKYLQDALYSLVGLTYPSVRALVCVDRSSPGYADSVRQMVAHLEGLLEVAVLEVPPHRAERGRPLNWGLDHATAEFVSFLDDDDVYYPSFGDRLIGCLRSHPDADVAYGIGQVVRGEAASWGFRALERIKRYEEPFDRAHLFVENYIPINTMVMRRSAIERAGIRFDEDLPIYEDWAFLRELAARFEFQFVNHVVSEYRLRTDGSNAVPEGSEQRWEQVAAQVRERYDSQPVRLRARELTDLVTRLRDAEGRTGSGTRVLQAEVAALTGRLAESRELNRRLVTSRSWRLTRPLRRLTRSRLPDEGGAAR